MDEQYNSGPYLFVEDLTVLDHYVAAISRFGPWRRRIYEVAPKVLADRSARRCRAALGRFLRNAFCISSGMALSGTVRAQDAGNKIRPLGQKCRELHWRARRFWRWNKFILPPTDIVPRAKLVTDIFVCAERRKTKYFVHGNARRIW